MELIVTKFPEIIVEIVWHFHLIILLLLLPSFFTASVFYWRSSNRLWKWQRNI